MAVAYGPAAALFAASRNTGYISQGSWGLPVVFVLQALTGEDLARSIVTKVGWVLLVVIAWMLSRVLPWDGVSEDFSVQRGSRSEIRAENPEKPNREPRHTQVDTLTPVVAETDQQAVAVRTAAVLSAAWVITSPWTLPWYDLIAWARWRWLPTGRPDAHLARGVVVRRSCHGPRGRARTRADLDVVAAAGNAARSSSGASWCGSWCGGGAPDTSCRLGLSFSELGTPQGLRRPAEGGPPGWLVVT